MTKRKNRRKTTPSKPVKAKWTDFYEHRLTDEQKAAITRMAFGDIEAFNSIAALASKGYKVSLAWYPHLEAYGCTVYGQYADNPNAGLALTQMHCDPIKAVAATIYIVEHVYAWQEWATESGSNQLFDW